MSKPINIIVIETLPLIMEGLTGILAKSNARFRLLFAESLDEAEMLFFKQECPIIIVNPAVFYPNAKLFNTVKMKFDQAKWVGLVFNWHNQATLALFDALISAADTPKTVETTINKLLDEVGETGQNVLQEILSGREIDVLKLLATGLANKEIADQLSISIHTVISHRKNISQKTGIKSVSGLTIYAVTQKLISIDSVKE